MHFPNDISTKTARSDLQDFIQRIGLVQSKINSHYEGLHKFYQKDQETIEEFIYRNRTEHDQRSSKIESLKEKIKAYKALSQSTEEMLEAKKSFLDLKIEIDLSHVRAEEEMIEKAKATKKELEDFLQIYEQRLGLEIRTNEENCVTFQFADINPVNKNQHFIEISYQDDVYKLHKCIPQIDDIELLMTDLNYSNNLRSFIIEVREKFVMLYR